MVATVHDRLIGVIKRDWSSGDGDAAWRVKYEVDCAHAYSAIGP
jgi:hypothetical protein